MSKELNDILYEVAEATFGSMAFMLSMPDTEEEIGSDQATTVRVGFAGPFGGELTMIVDEEMLSELAGNMLGLDPGEEAPHDQQVDALKELLNVICGNLLPKIAGVEVVFDVASPQIVAQGETPSLVAPKASVKLCLDSGMAELTLYTDQAVPAGL